MISDKFHTDELDTDFLWNFYIFSKRNNFILFIFFWPALLEQWKGLRATLHLIQFSLTVNTFKLMRIIIIYKLCKKIPRLEEPFPKVCYLKTKNEERQHGGSWIVLGFVLVFLSFYGPISSIATKLKEKEWNLLGINT